MRYKTPEQYEADQKARREQTKEILAGIKRRIADRERFARAQKILNKPKKPSR